MNQRDHDMIVRAAFGESERGEQAFVDEMLRRDPEAKALFDEFANLQFGLRDLDEAPPCQLSTERLRLAIQAQVVQPVRHTAPWRAPWGIGLAAAACLAVAVVIMQKPADVARSTDVVASHTPTVEKPSNLGLSSGAPTVEAPPVVASVDPSEAPVTLDNVMESTPNVHRHAKAKVTDRNVLPATTSGAPTLGKDDPKNMSFRTSSDPQMDANPNVRENGAPNLRDVAAYDTTVPEGPVVVVQPQTDPQTGAALAIETNHASDFVFGG